MENTYTHIHPCIGICIQDWWSELLKICEQVLVALSKFGVIVSYVDLKTTVVRHVSLMEGSMMYFVKLCWLFKSGSCYDKRPDEKDEHNMIQLVFYYKLWQWIKEIWQTIYYTCYYIKIIAVFSLRYIAPCKKRIFFWKENFLCLQLYLTHCSISDVHTKNLKRVFSVSRLIHILLKKGSFYTFLEPWKFCSLLI